VLFEYDKNLPLFNTQWRNSNSSAQVETLSHYQRKGAVIKTLIACYEAAHRQFTNLPPNSTGNLAYDILLHIQIRALTDLHLHLVFRSPLTTQTQPERLEEDSESPEDGLGDALCVDDHRMKLLSDLYALAPPSFLKAKSAFALAIHHGDTLEDYELSERLFFESVYMLDTLPMTVQIQTPAAAAAAAAASSPSSSSAAASGTSTNKSTKDKAAASPPAPTHFTVFSLQSPVVSEVGSNALVHYGNLLYLNRKYKYAIHAFDSALTMYNMRGRQRDFFGLMRRVAKIAQSENDLVRAIDYYEEIVKDYRSQARTNEVRSLLSLVFK